MDQALKARLIGAVIIVGLGVLVIPELLSGRKGEPPATPPVAAASPASRTIPIELGTPSQRGGEPTATTATPIAEQPGKMMPAPAQTGSVQKIDEPTVAEKAAPSVEPRPKDAVATVPARNDRDAAPAAAPSTGVSSVASTPKVATATTPGGRQSSAGGGRTWSVQVGAFGSASAAEKLAKELDGAGYAAYVAASRQGSRPLHRVRVGPVTERAEADRLASRLKARGLPVAVVAND
jgi:cell division septation protein DedD